MSFPETRPTLIQRIAAENREADWQEFLKDYWRPVCRFAGRWGKLSYDDAEDVASATFEVLIAKDLLSAWASNPAAKLRSLLCRIIRNLLANKTRIQQGRKELLQKNLSWIKEMEGIHLNDAVDRPEELDAFFESWVDEVVQEAVDELFQECQKTGRGDVFRVLYGRICEQMPMHEVARCLRISPDTAQNHFKLARKLLDRFLRREVERRVSKYAAPQQVQAEFEAEWRALSESLIRRGGLEASLQQFADSQESRELKRREQRSVTTIIACLHPPGQNDG